ncbi:hypothetical protein BpHYR1_030436 [Brachionus plicatilis]|uniref:Uncharacterized protein n=1 Tax=Brachionus plicatilis TaxID=10195 RepID=A0A3M7R6C0_BRAPC|nr:hypothetical protein BpHYR1_030436 [Brachionus plicatilis]
MEKSCFIDFTSRRCAIGCEIYENFFNFPTFRSKQTVTFQFYHLNDQDKSLISTNAFKLIRRIVNHFGLSRGFVKWQQLSFGPTCLFTEKIEDINLSDVKNKGVNDIWS